jgi:hypothetical protein
MHAGLEEAGTALGDRLVAAYAIGSLAHGGFAPAVSDVDLVLILDALGAHCTTDMRDVRSRVAASVDTPLAGRLSLFWSTWQILSTAGHGGRLPLVDRDDLVRHGVCLRGEDHRDRVLLPRGDQLYRELVLEATLFMLDKFATRADGPLPLDTLSGLRQDCREVTKGVLFPVRFVYTVETGQVGTNSQAADHYCSNAVRPARELVLAALQWRERGTVEVIAQTRAIFAEGLAPLYLELIDVYAGALARLGRSDLQWQLERWRARIRAG